MSEEPVASAELKAQFKQGGRRYWVIGEVKVPMRLCSQQPLACVQSAGP